MTKYIDKERARYWPVSKELMVQYRDGSHTYKDRYGGLDWRNKNDILHRDGDKPARIWPDGRLGWFKNGQYHRNGDKPAYIGADCTLYWCQNGKTHRSCGPAVIYSDGKCKWWVNHEEITQEVRKWLNKKHWRGTPEQIVEFQLRFV